MPDPVAVVLLARLALDRTEQRKRLAATFLSMRCAAVCAAAASSEHERWLVAMDDQAVAFYRHSDFHQLDDRRLWRRLADVAGALGE